MGVVEIGDLASIGLIRDVEAYTLPPEAWSEAQNMRFNSDGAERMQGRTQIFGTPPVAPHFAIPVADSSQVWWLYASLAKGYVYDGVSHTDITRTSGGDYTASETRQWNGTLLGGVPILNNGVDTPQYWASYSAAQKLADLPNWPAGYKARSIRAFGPYLLALNVNKAGADFPHLVLWSHPADPGSVPVSWDVADPTRDAGQTDLPDVQAGLIVDGLPLRGNFYVYTEGSTWRLVQVGSTFVFDFKAFLETSGILAPRCMTITADGFRHVVATQDDIIVHDGNSATSLLDKRYKRYLANAIDTTNYQNSFMFTNPFTDEVWFCYPESGAVNPTRALVWSYKQGQLGALSECAVNFRNAATGVIESASDAAWSIDEGAWSVDSGPWSLSSRRKLVLCKTDDSKFVELDSGTTDDGTVITGLLQRTGLSVIGRDRKGAWISDYETRKLITRVWIKASGGPIDVRVGFQETPDGTVTWSPSQSFTPATQKFVDVAGSGISVCVEFSASVPFRIMSYKFDMAVIGVF